MIFNESRLARGSLFLTLLLLSGCRHHEATVDVARLVPAQVSLAGLSSVAVLPHSGHSGAFVTHQIYAYLHTQTSLHTLDCDITNSSTYYHKGVAWTQQEAAEAAQRLGVDAVIYGEIDAVEINVSYDADAQGYNTHYSRYISVDMVATARIVHRAGHALGSVLLNGSDAAIPAGSVLAPGLPRYDAEFLASLAPPIDNDAVLFAAASRMADQFGQATRPHYAMSSVTLYHDSRSGDSEAAIRAASLGEWRYAAQIYSDILHNSRGREKKYRAAATYNLGVALTYSNEYEAARSALESVAGQTRDRRLIYLSRQALDDLYAIGEAQAQSAVGGWSWEVRS